MPTNKILIVEDEPAILEMLTITLGQAGFATISALDVSSAQALLIDKNPDLIVLDWMLPGTSGVEWARRLKKDPSNREIPIDREG
jgi:two-component system, OmpR family, phosphate regulon response regulator PhoB